MSKANVKKAVTEMVNEQKSALEKNSSFVNLNSLAEYQKPKKRSECKSMKRPCLFVSCKHHLYLDVNPESKSIKFNFPGKEIWELTETCSLDIAEKGGSTLEELGTVLNLTRERIRQVEAKALQKLRKSSVKFNLNLTFLDS